MEFFDKLLHTLERIAVTLENPRVTIPGSDPVTAPPATAELGSLPEGQVDYMALKRPVILELIKKRGLEHLIKPNVKTLTLQKALVTQDATAKVEAASAVGATAGLAPPAPPVGDVPPNDSPVAPPVDTSQFVGQPDMHAPPAFTAAPPVTGTPAYTPPPATGAPATIEDARELVKSSIGMLAHTKGLPVAKQILDQFQVPTVAALKDEHLEQAYNMCVQAQKNAAIPTIAPPLVPVA